MPGPFARAPFPIDRRSPAVPGHPEQEKMAPAAGNSAIRRTERRRIARSITTRPPVRPPEEVRRAETRPGRNRNRMSPPPRGSPGKRPASSPKFRNIPPLYGRGSRISNGHTEQTARTRPYDGSSPFAAELVLISPETRFPLPAGSGAVPLFRRNRFGRGDHAQVADRARRSHFRNQVNARAVESHQDRAVCKPRRSP